MKTTIEIADPLLIQAKAVAAEEKISLRALIEQALQQFLKGRKKPAPFKLKDCSYDGGGLTEEQERRGGWKNIRRLAYEPDEIADDFESPEDDEDEPQR